MWRNQLDIGPCVYGQTWLGWGCCEYGNESPKFKKAGDFLGNCAIRGLSKGVCSPQKKPQLTKLHLSTTLGRICLSTFRSFGGKLHWKMTPVVCIVRIIWEVHHTFVYSLNWTHYIIHANTPNLSSCFRNVLVMCLFIWKQIGSVIMETLSIFCSPLCAMMMLSKDLWEVKGRAMNRPFYCPEIPVASISLGRYIKTFFCYATQFFNTLFIGARCKSVPWTTIFSPLMFVSLWSTFVAYYCVCVSFIQEASFLQVVPLKFCIKILCVLQSFILLSMI